MFFYNLTSENVTDPISAYIVDGKPERGFTNVVALEGPFPPTRDEFVIEVDGGYKPSPPVFSYFTRDDIEKEELLNLGAEGVYDIFGHVCMGHIFMLVETETKNYTAPVAIQLSEEDEAEGRDAKTACEAAMAKYMPADSPMASMHSGHDHSHEGVMSMAPEAEMEGTGQGGATMAIGSVALALLGMFVV